MNGWSAKFEIQSVGFYTVSFVNSRVSEPGYCMMTYRPLFAGTTDELTPKHILDIDNISVNHYLQARVNGAARRS